MNEEINTISEEQVLHNELSFEINQELIHLMKRIVELQQENTLLKDKLKDIKIILNSNHDVEHNYCALSQYLNIFDYELDLEDYLFEQENKQLKEVP